MILQPIYNFFSKIYEGIEELRSYDGDIVDVSVGRMSPEEVINTALSVAQDKEWIGKSGQPDLIADEPILFHYTRRKQLVWIVDFSWYLTKEELETKFEDFNVKSITLAAVKIDDAAGEVMFADFIRGRFNENYEPVNPEEQAAIEKRQRRIVGSTIAFLALCGNIWVWLTAIFHDHIYEAAGIMLPCIFISGLGLGFFDGFINEDAKSKKDNSELITARGWTIVIIGLLVGFANLILLKSL